VRVCVDQTCAKHWPKRETVTRHRTAGSSAPKESAEAKRKRLAKEATARRSLELAQARRETVEERALDEFIERAGTLQTRDLLLRGVVCELLRGDVNFETFNERFGVKASYQSKPADLKKLVGDTLLQALAFCVGDQDLQHAYGDWKRAELMKAFGVDLARIDKEVAEEQASQEALANSDAPSAKKKSAGEGQTREAAEARDARQRESPSPGRHAHRSWRHARGYVRRLRPLRTARRLTPAARHGGAPSVSEGGAERQRAW
jgi:hypothetical protein